MTTNEQQQVAQQVAARRQNGETWGKIAADLKIAETTLRGRVYRTGLLSPKQQRARRRAAAVAAAAVESAPVAAVAAPAAPAVALVNTAPKFVEPTWYPLMKYAVGSEKGATMFGPRGCGKSTAIRHLAAELNRPTITMQCAANMQIDALIGSWTSENGTLRFIDGPLTIAVRSGSWLLAEEANVIHPGVWSAVNTLTDQTGEGLRLPTGEMIAPSPDFRLVLIYNEGYSGTREVNAALKDRLMPIYCGYLSAADEIALLESKTGASNLECSRVQSVAGLIRAADLRFDLSPRSLVRWIKLVKEAGLTWGQAFERAIMDLVGPPELEKAKRAVLGEIANNTVAQW